MPRRARTLQDGLPHHVLNRAVRRATLFDDDEAYAEFESLLWQALQRHPVELLAYCAMPTHWHLIVRSNANTLPVFMHWLTTVHAQHWHRRFGTTGTGPVYQNRYKSIVVTNDRHFLTVCRYVERNALNAGLVSHAEDWRWCSLWRRHHRCADGWLATPPVQLPKDWTAYVNKPLQTVTAI